MKGLPFLLSIYSLTICILCEVILKYILTTVTTYLGPVEDTAQLGYVCECCMSWWIHILVFTFVRGNVFSVLSYAMYVATDYRHIMTRSKIFYEKLLTCCRKNGFVMQNHRLEIHIYIQADLPNRPKYLGYLKKNSLWVSVVRVCNSQSVTSPKTPTVQQELGTRDIVKLNIMVYSFLDYIQKV